MSIKERLIRIADAFEDASKQARLLAQEIDERPRIKIDSQDVAKAIRDSSEGEQRRAGQRP